MSPAVQVVCPGPNSVEFLEKVGVALGVDPLRSGPLKELVGQVLLQPWEEAVATGHLKVGQKEPAVEGEHDVGRPRFSL